MDKALPPVLKQNILLEANPEDVVMHDLFCMDNLDFLSVVKTTHAKTIDFCYIDPPYNTGGTARTGFTYHDSFKKHGDASRHASWVEFMEPRLIGLLPLLKDTGIVAISIDDSEVHHLRVLCDKIFGENNFIAQMIVDGGAMKNNAKLVSVTHEYLLVYAKNISKVTFAGTKWRTDREGIAILRKKEAMLRKKHKANYVAISKELKPWMKTTKFSKRLQVFFNVDAKGLYTYADLSAPNSTKFFEYLHPITGKPVQVPSRGWGVSYENLKKMEENGDIIFFEDETKQPMKKLYLKDGKDQVIKSILSYPSRTSTHLLEKMLGRRSSFSNPKNLDFIKFIIDSMCPNEGVILDYFAGSGTTGHAVAELNKEVTSNRKFILCTNNENDIYEDVTKPRVIAALTGIWGNGTKYKPSSGGLRENCIRPA